MPRYPRLRLYITFTQTLSWVLGLAVAIPGFFLALHMPSPWQQAVGVVVALVAATVV